MHSTNTEYQVWKQEKTMIDITCSYEKFEEVFTWNEENINGCWFLEPFGRKTKYEKKRDAKYYSTETGMYRFSFDNKDDAAMFKLAWG